MYSDGASLALGSGRDDACVLRHGNGRDVCRLAVPNDPVVSNFLADGCSSFDIIGMYPKGGEELPPTKRVMC